MRTPKTTRFPQLVVLPPISALLDEEMRAMILSKFRNLESFFGDKNLPPGLDEGTGLSNTWTNERAVTPQGLQRSIFVWTDR